MDILIVAHFIGDIEHLKQINNRFVYLAGMFAQTHSVEVVTTSFVHSYKKHSDNIPSEFNGFKITTLFEPGYKKNISLKRLYSHKVFADNVCKYLETRRKPDVIYCGVPSLDVAHVAAKYAQKHNIPFIIDIQDLWPEAFKMALNIPILSDIVFYPMAKKANYIYSRAHSIIGVSKTYSERAKLVNANAKALSVFLGTDLDTFDHNASQNKAIRNDDKILIGYCGTLGHSYDLRCVFDALHILKSEEKHKIELLVLGSGPLYESFREYAEKLELDVTFHNWLPYQKMCGILASCDICINPINKNAAQSIINKHADYAASGLPVISTQECAEYKELIDGYYCGINCMCADPVSVADAIRFLAENKDERIRMGINARRMAEELFDRKRTYNEILKIVNSIKE